jgi:hemerythrin
MTRGDQVSCGVDGPKWARGAKDQPPMPSNFSKPWKTNTPGFPTVGNSITFRAQALDAKLDGPGMKINRRLLLTGIPLIDQQHEEYANLVERLFALVAQGGVAKEMLLEETRTIIKYATEHFYAEEYLMRSHDYPDFAEHLAKHNLFRDWTDKLSSDLEGEPDLNEYVHAMSQWLADWFCQQVQTDDRKLAVFLKRKELLAPAGPSP